MPDAMGGLMGGQPQQQQQQGLHPDALEQIAQFLGQRASPQDIMNLFQKLQQYKPMPGWATMGPPQGGQ